MRQCLSGHVFGHDGMRWGGDVSDRDGLEAQWIELQKAHSYVNLPKDALGAHAQVHVFKPSTNARSLYPGA